MSIHGRVRHYHRRSSAKSRSPSIQGELPPYRRSEYSAVRCLLFGANLTDVGLLRYVCLLFSRRKNIIALGGCVFCIPTRPRPSTIMNECGTYARTWQLSRTGWQLLGIAVARPPPPPPLSSWQSSSAHSLLSRGPAASVPSPRDSDRSGSSPLPNSTNQRQSVESRRSSRKWRVPCTAHAPARR